MTSPSTPHQFLLLSSLHPILSSHLFLLSALLAPTISIISFFRFASLDRLFSATAIVSSAFVYAGVTHELSTFLLRFRDMGLSHVTPSTFLQAFVRSVILIVTKAINLVDLHWENSYGEFINCQSQRYIL